MSKYTDKFIVCACGSSEHLIRLQLFQWTNKYNEITDVDASIEIHLMPERSFFRRLWIGIKYILGFDQKHGHFDDLVLNRDKAKELIDFLQMYVGYGSVDHE